ncbi:Reverse transcriptase (RNA-dependent DNA polymerase) [Popillia japonica]|uniref:Reverse transcriptase (RNA-dependent DNA polymerase) n=1 Tax=Popillia japonica TaxID=7064 RepID=A0AAW1IE72_POPJA
MYTAAQIWSALKELYDNRGLTRQIGLLRKLITIRLENCSSMANYVNEIIGTANKLKGVGFDITDDSGVKINGDMIKSKLLDGNYKKGKVVGALKKLDKREPKVAFSGIYPEKGKVVGALKKLDKREPKVAFSAIYVDDLLIFWKDINDRDNLKNALSEAFHMKDIGKAKHCIGLNITYDKEIKAILLDQSKYIKEILATFGMAACKPAATPSDPSQRLSVRMCNTDEVIENVPYQEAAGSLLYLAQGTRPDIAHAVNDIGLRMSISGVQMWLKQLAQNLDTSFKIKPTTIVGDNQSAAQLI